LDPGLQPSDEVKSCQYNLVEVASMTTGENLTPLQRRDRALERMDAGHRALHESLEGLDPEDAFLGSRWSVWEVLQHLDTPNLVDQLEKLAAGELDQFPPFGGREDRLRQDVERLDANFQRYRALVAGLSEEQLARPMTPPNPHNAYPGLTVLELIERLAGHEANHARQIETTREYVAAFSSRQRAVTIVGLGAGEQAPISPETLGLISYADYVAGSEQALAVVRQWVRGVEIVIRDDNKEEVLARLGREARTGIWAVVCCLGDAARPCPELVALAQEYCDHVAVHPAAPGSRPATE
jgi:hypothetical protein